MHLRAESPRRYGCVAATQAVGGGWTVGESLAGAETRWAGRRRQAEERKAAERALREAAAAAAREQRLDMLAANPERAWQQVAELIATNKPKEYESAVVGSVQATAAAKTAKRSPDSGVCSFQVTAIGRSP